MGVKIVDGATIKAEELIVTVYGRPGVGKTTFALSAKNPLVLDFDRGAKRAPNRKGVAVIECKKWKHIEDLTEEDVEPYDAVVVDTGGTCIKALAQEVMKEDARNGRNGVLSLAGYGAVKGRFRGWLNMVRSWGKDIIIVVHLREESRGEDPVERIDVDGSSDMEIYQQSDVMGRLEMTKDGKRVFRVHPTSAAHGKSSGLKDMEVGNIFTEPEQMAMILDMARKSINDMGEKGIQKAEKADQVRERFTTITTIKGIRNAKKELEKQGADAVTKSLLVSRARELGYKWSKEKGDFVKKSKKKKR